MDLNRIMLIGNLTRDPETRTIASGSTVTSFSIAVNERRSKGASGEEEVMFIRVSAWNKTGELVAQYMKKGSQVLVEGRLKIDKYTAKDGQERQEPTVVADRVSFGAKPREGEGGGGGGYRDEAPRSSSGPSRSAPPRQSEPARDFDQGGGTEDDLPF
ncbi:single-stranded DNA-binding protein [soil metagenome]